MSYVKINKLEEDLYRRGDGAGAIDSMLARFHHQVQASGILRDLKKHEFYEKPSTKRCREQREATLRRVRKERKDALHKTGNKGRNRRGYRQFAYGDKERQRPEGHSD